MSNKQYTILLVEDEQNLHEALKLNLELENYEVTSAFDGAAALKAVNSEYFDLIILDVMLPEVDGINVAETIRLQNNEVPILMLSAKNSALQVACKPAARLQTRRWLKRSVMSPAGRVNRNMGRN